MQIWVEIYDHEQKIIRASSMLKMSFVVKNENLKPIYWGDRYEFFVEDYGLNVFPISLSWDIPFICTSNCLENTVYPAIFSILRAFNRLFLSNIQDPNGKWIATDTSPI